MDRLKLSGFLSSSLLIGLALVAVPVEAGTDSWSVAGQLSGGTVGNVVVDPSTPSTVYAVADQQIFKSTDSGATWALILSAASPTLTGDIAIDPQSPATLYAVFGVFLGAPGNITAEQGVVASDPGGIYKSIDGGATWSQIDKGIGLNTNWETGGHGTQAVDTLCHVAVDPVTEGVVYAGGCSSGMYKSTDGGASWKPIDTGLAPASVAANVVNNLVVDPVTPAVLYVDSSYLVQTPTSSTWTSQLHQSTDGGQTWNALGVNASGADADVAIDPSDHTHLLFCGALGGSVSTDSGATWNAAGCPSFTMAVAFDPSNPLHVIYGTLAWSPVSIYESVDGGATFNANTDVPANGVGSIAFDPATPANIYIGTANWGVMKSTDGGTTWSASSAGITGVHVGQMLEGSDGVFYMGTDNAGIYKSLDQGATWAAVGKGAGSLPYFTYVTLSALVQDPSKPATLYAGSWAGLYSSTDGGDTWNPSMTGMPSGTRVVSITIDPEVPATIYAGMYHLAGANMVAGLYKSVDGGASWSSASTGLGLRYEQVNGITVDPHDSAVVFAADDYDGIYKSVDGGAHWTLSKSGMGSVEFFTVAVDPTDSNVVYASALQGFFKSTDGGSTWAESDTGMALGSQIDGNIQIDPADAFILYVSPKYGFGQTYVSGDAGATWSALTTGLASASTSSIHTSRRTEAVSTGTKQITLGAAMIDPRHPTQVYAGGSDGKVYAYNDLHPPAPSSSGNTGGSSGSGGGGGFSWLIGLALLGAGIARKRR